MAELVCAVDIGTSSCRAIVVDERGAAVGRTKETYSIERPRPGFEEQDPDEIRDAVWRTIGRCVANIKHPEAIRALSFSSQLYSLIALDGAGRPLTNSILWSDGRAAAQARAIAAENDTQDLYRATGCPPSSIYPIAKVRWLHEFEPELFATVRRFVSIKEYVLSELLNEALVDWSIASATGMFDIRRREWDARAVAAGGISNERLSQPVNGAVARVAVNPGRLKSLGLPTETKIVLGGGDGPLANVGAGAVAPGAINIDLGTSGAIRVVVDRPVIDDRAAGWCYCLSHDRWVYGGILTNVGNALAWVAGLGNSPKPQTCETPGQLMQSIAALPREPAELLFLPYLRPVRSPYWSDELSGTLLGLRPEHDRRHIGRALLEAIAFDLRTTSTLVDRAVPNTGPLVLSGGLARSPIVAQTIATILNRRLYTRENKEASLLGAAVLGFRALGLLPDLAFSRGPVDDAGTTDANCYEPEEHLVGPYARRYQRYTDAVEAVRTLVISWEGKR